MPTITSRAAVCRAFGHALSLEKIAIDWSPLRSHEVLVRVCASGVCHTDLHAIRGEMAIDLPVIMGHECSGVVEAVGDDVRTVRPAARVVVSLLRSCGHCDECRSAKGHLCSAAWTIDLDGRLRASDGTRVWAGLNVGSFADYVVVDESQVVNLPDHLPLETAAVLGCGVITGIGAAINTAQVKPGSSVLVIGAGCVGLNVIQGARLAGAETIVASDPLDGKLSAARRFGATHQVHPEELDHDRFIRELTAGRGVDYAFITIGKQSAVDAASRSTKRGGTVIVCAIPPLGTHADLDLRFFSGERQVKGSTMGSTQLQVDVPNLAELYRQGRVKLDELISERFAFADINDAITSALAGNAIRNLVVFGSATL